MNPTPPRISTARLAVSSAIWELKYFAMAASFRNGAPDSRNLPTNLEIEEALRAYQQLYQADEQPERVQRLREVAVEIMRLLAQFNPYLTGAVLSGSASRHADVHLQVYTDSLKELEIFLLNREIPFRTREIRVWIGDTEAVVPDLVLSTAEADVHVTVLSPHHRRQPLRLSLDGRPLDRAPLESVETLLAAG